MTRPVVPIAAALIFVLSSAGQTHAASFDCSQAKSPDEIAICNNPELSALDSEMGGLWYAYNLLPFLMGESGNRRDEAVAFLQTRGQCGSDVSCLTQAYRSRIATLQQDLQSGIHELCQD
ncbi:MAG: hypothetical protein AAF414_08570 [Pseudomonadota bacterium]